MTTPADQLRTLATEAISKDRTIDGPYPPAALASSAVEAILDPANRDVLLAALGATPVGWKPQGSRLLHDDPRTPAPAGARQVFVIVDPRSFT